MDRKRYSDEDCLKLLREIAVQLASGLIQLDAMRFATADNNPPTITHVSARVKMEPACHPTQTDCPYLRALVHRAHSTTGGQPARWKTDCARARWL